MFTIGFRTRLFHLLSLVCAVSLNDRVFLMENGGQYVLHLLIIWTFFLPLGRRFSVDAALGRARDDRPIRSPAVVGLLLQFAVIYLLKVLHKTGTDWRDGSAVHYTLHHERLVTTFGVWMRENAPVAVLEALPRCRLDWATTSSSPPTRTTPPAPVPSGDIERISKPGSGATPNAPETHRTASFASRSGSCPAGVRPRERPSHPWDVVCCSAPASPRWTGGRPGIIDIRCRPSGDRPRGATLRRSSRGTWLAVCALLSCLAPGLVALPDVRIDPAKTWVGMARVHLTVSDLQLSGRQLDGAYDIRVPFLPGKNDTGTLRLHSSRTIDEISRDGGAMAGTARSVSGETREVICEIEPGGAMRIDIALERRTVSFKTRYHISPGF